MASKRVDVKCDCLDVVNQRKGTGRIGHTVKSGSEFHGQPTPCTTGAGEGVSVPGDIGTTK